MHQIVDVIKLIGKRGLSYYNRNNEAACTLNDTSLDHGNFLEIIILLSKYDEVIKCYLDKFIKKVLRVTMQVLLKAVGGTTIHERLVGIVKCTSSKGINVVELILKVFNSLNLDPKKCVGNSTDGAAKMQREYHGFSAQLSNVAKKQIHIWCCTHVLNLVIGDVTNEILQSINLFGILNGCAVFIKESHKCMDVWTNKEKNK
ncbi:Ribonuclease H-like domain [Cinara cedri]|uniref:Ribonuclease H-like domain n=1 Tax=Cinara cedri TaxID=506608 RepID=A0A5E4NHF1_9HEMI|nr:Ribonuclease H-like domain [Cinara cedri]